MLVKCENQYAEVSFENSPEDRELFESIESEANREGVTPWGLIVRMIEEGLKG
jgi:hypothetical protein